MPKEFQYRRYCDRTGRRVAALEIEVMNDSLNTLWWRCPACGDWHAEINEERKMPTVKKGARH